MLENTFQKDLNILKQKLTFAIGNYSYIKIEEPIFLKNNIYLINVFVNCNDNIAKCIRAILPKFYNLKNTTVYVRVFNSSNTEINFEISSFTEEDVAHLFYIALYNNMYFKGCLLTKYYLPIEILDFIGQIVIVVYSEVLFSKNTIKLSSPIETILNEVFILYYNPDIKVSFVSNKNIFFNTKFL